METTAIIGGGPAGATAAERLAAGSHSWRVLVFEEKAGWEKPCGGGLTTKVLRRFPFLADAAEPHVEMRDAEFVAAGGESVRLHLTQPIAVYSRQVLNELLLRRARAAGAEVIHERVSGFGRAAGGWEIATRSGRVHADYLVLAAGARSLLRRQLAPSFGAGDFVQTFGYYAPVSDPTLRVKFFKEFEGYAWAFPRPTHLSLGIAGKVGEGSMAGLKDRLHSFMGEFGYDSDEARKSPIFSHVLPTLGHESWRKLALGGPGWALVGDAAGLVDPVTGEGIYYAMRSGELLARALGAGRPERYPVLVRRDFGGRLAFGARLAHRFYLGTFRGKPVTTRMIDYARRSQAFRTLIQDLIDGRQAYPSLAARVLWTFAQAAVDLLGSGTAGSGGGPTPGPSEAVASGK